MYGSIAARLAGVPVVWHVRDRVAEDYIPPAAVRLVRALVRRLASAVIANSDATLATLDGHAPANSWVIPASVEPSPLPRSPGPHTTFGMLGRIAPWKGQDLFLRAFAEAFPDGDETAVLIGAPMFGEEEYERSLHRARGQPRARRAGALPGLPGGRVAASWRGSTCSSTPPRSRSRSGRWCSRGWPPAWR